MLGVPGTITYGLGVLMISLSFGGGFKQYTESWTTVLVMIFGVFL